MIRLKRPAKPKNWSSTVERALKNYAAFLDRARRFETLELHSRRSGFALTDKDALPKNRKGEAYFPSAWGSVKQALWRMSNRKCAYCEAEITGVRLGQVDHFRPKSLFPTLAYEWENYFLACGACNGAKSNQWPDAGGYLRPDQAGAEAELWFEADGTVRAARGGVDAELTIAHFDLMRAWLVELRKKHIDTMLGRVKRYEDLMRVDPDLAREWAEEERKLVSDPKLAYSAALTQCFSREWERVSSSGG